MYQEEFLFPPRKVPKLQAKEFQKVEVKNETRQSRRRTMRYSALCLLQRWAYDSYIVTCDHARYNKTLLSTNSNLRYVFYTTVQTGLLGVAIKIEITLRPRHCWQTDRLSILFLARNQPGLLMAVFWHPMNKSLPLIYSSTVQITSSERGEGSAAVGEELASNDWSPLSSTEPRVTHFILFSLNAS